VQKAGDFGQFQALFSGRTRAGILGSSLVLAAFAARLLWLISTVSQTVAQPQGLATAGA
jgi:hypothetical protein